MKRIKGSASAAGSVTASGIKYPGAGGVAGQVIKTDGAGALSPSDPTGLPEDIGTVSTNTILTGESRAILDSEAGSIDIQLPDATGSQDAYLLDGGQVGDPVGITVDGASSSLVDGIGSGLIEKAASTYIVLDRGVDDWALYRPDYRGGTTVWQPNTYYQKGQIVQKEGFGADSRFLLAARTSHTSGSGMLDGPEMLNWGPAPGAKYIQMQTGYKVAQPRVMGTEEYFFFGTDLHLYKHNEGSYFNNLGQDAAVTGSSYASTFAVVQEGGIKYYSTGRLTVNVVLDVQANGTVVLNINPPPSINGFNGTDYARGVQANGQGPSNRQVISFSIPWTNVGSPVVSIRKTSGTVTYRGIHSFYNEVSFTTGPSFVGNS